MPRIWYWFKRIFIVNYLLRGIFECIIVELNPGFASLNITGKDVDIIFGNESGGHRFQHTSGDRIHTSTITVAALKEPTIKDLVINSNDLSITTTKGSGPGGQHKNKVESCVCIKHIPTGISVRCDSGRSQHQNKDIALKTLRARVYEGIQLKNHREQCFVRNSQIGSGKSGDKRRTVQIQHNIVKDVDGRKWRYQDYRNGKW